MLDSSDNYVALDEVDEEKDLGVTFQSNLKFDKHISSIIAKVQRVLLRLPTLEYRRDRNDMIQIYKAIRGIDDINWMSLFMLVPSTATRGYSLKIFKKQCRTTQVTHLLHEDLSGSEVCYMG
jgi:hypothetical protein